MAKTTPSMIAAKCGPQFKSRLNKALKKSGLTQSVLVRTAVGEFLKKSPEEQLDSVIRSRTAFSNGK